MFGQLVYIPHTRMAIPNPWQCLVWVAPLLAVAALWWLVDNADRIINYLFPNLEWERSLGWLNIQAERRAQAAMRWLGYGIYLLLAAVLYGIVRLADGFPDLANWTDPWVVGDLVLRIPALAICLGVWLLYLGGWLVPKLRREREEAGLKKHRAEMKEVEEERERHRAQSRVKMPLQKPRTNSPFESESPTPPRRKSWPGG
jgi:signal transduction histidine kinase